MQKMRFSDVIPLLLSRKTVQISPRIRRTATSYSSVDRDGSGCVCVFSDVRDLMAYQYDTVPEIVSVMPGLLTDWGITDAGNMGAAMAPAASDTLERFMAHHSPSEYDMIITGDLGRRRKRNTRRFTEIKEH